MILEDAAFWLKYHYPVTIVADRYDGCYSGGGWLAFPLEMADIPDGVSAEDAECDDFWCGYTEPVGRGNSPQSAMDDLIGQMEEIVGGYLAGLKRN